MAFTVTEEVGTCIFMVKCSYLEGRKNDKNKKSISVFLLQVFCLCFLSCCVLVMYVGFVGTVCNLAKVEALQLLDQF